MSGVALWLLTLLSAPWFLPPRDGLASSVAAGLVLVAIDLQSVPNFRYELDVLRWIATGYCITVALSAIAALLLNDLKAQQPVTKLVFRLTGIWGRGELLFTTPALISIIGAYQSDFSTMAWLVILWMFLAMAQVIEQAAFVVRGWFEERSIVDASNDVGFIERIDHPGIVRVRLTPGRIWQPETLHVAAMPDGHQEYVIALFMQVQGTDVVGTGLCVGSLQEPISLASGQVRRTHDAEMAAEFLERISGTPEATLVGFTVENSTIGTLRFEVTADRALQEGDVVFARIEGNETFYQILDAETAEESFDQNPRGTHIVLAAQLGVYDDRKGFQKFPWLPKMNTPLFSARTRSFPEPVLNAQEFVIGKVPSAELGVVANIDRVIEYHTAILGVTGTGKTELALDLVREALRSDAKVFCVDFTGDYAQRLSDLDPALLGPSDNEATNLQNKLFEAETGKYGAGDEKKALQMEIDRLRTSTKLKIESFLERDNHAVAILEIAEIANSKATLRLTELYLSTIMEWARKNRQARRIMIVLEEAHTIVPETAGSGFDYDTQWVVGRIGQIALQGRKYGVGLLVVTQRTALVSKTILSQCNTFLTHNLIDQTSLNFLQSVYSSEHSRIIPNLSRFEFLAFGKAINAERPIVIRREFDQAKKDASDSLRQPLLENALNEEHV